jgi:hypothetical protein
MAVRIEDVSPRDGNTTLLLGRNLQSVSGKALCCALSPDGRRAYLGGHSGVWRSDDGGRNWRHLEWPQPPAGSTAVPGALLVPNVYDLLISAADPDVVLAAVGRDPRRTAQEGVWRSADGGATWARVHQFVRGDAVADATCLAAAPDDPRLVFAAGGLGVARSSDGGLTWTESVPQQDPDHESVWYVAVARRSVLDGRRRVYAAGSHIWFSLDEGLTWRQDPEPLSLGAPADGAGQGSRSLSVDPRNARVLFVATFDPNFENGKGIVQRGEFPAFPGGPAAWTSLPPMRSNFPDTTDSGTSFVVAHVAPNGDFYLIASDRRTLQSSFGEPKKTGNWFRIEDGRCHLDPHGLAVTPNFRRWRLADPPLTRPGRILLVNDGGANFSTNGARTWSNGRGLATLDLVNVAVNPGRRGPGICFGGPDNSGFWSPDGGGRWQTQRYVGGDNDACFADLLQPSRLIVFAPLDEKGSAGVGLGLLHLYVSPDASPPNAARGTRQARLIPGAPPPEGETGPTIQPAWSANSRFFGLGYRPLVLTLRGQTPPPDGDFVVIRFGGAWPELLRTTKLSSIEHESDWLTAETADDPGVRVFRVGPPLPSPDVSVVQVSGGHAAPVFYVGAPFKENGGTLLGARLVGEHAPTLWKWTAGMAAWQQVVPALGDGPVPQSSPPFFVRRFFVDPYRPSLVYLVEDHVWRSDDGGASWRIDAPLERAVTENGQFPFDYARISPVDGGFDQTLIRDMLFDPDRPGVRFAIGPAGVFHTLDGRTWNPLLLSSAAAMRPVNAAYDFVSCPRALYVATSNRGLLRLSPLPPDWDFPLGSLQAAEGRITRLRVHELGGGFGPPTDRLDAEVIVELDSEPEKAFGLQLRDNAQRQVAKGMLDVLRDTFNRGRPVRIEFVRSGCRTGRIVRVIER